MPPKTSIAISPIRVARQLRGVSAKELAEVIERSGPWISQLEKGTKELPDDAARALGAFLGVPASFLQGEALSAPLIQFRHLKRTPAAQKARVEARAVLVDLLLREIERDFGGLPRPDLGSNEALVGDPGDPGRLAAVERAAQRLRADWGLADGPIPDITRLVESKGFWVIQLPPEDRKVDAFSWWGNGHGFIAVNPVPLDGSEVLSDESQPRNAYRERFNVAHELGHKRLHREIDGEIIGTREVEGEAHRFAASFLVPARQWMAIAPRTTDWRAFVQHAGTWGVSISVLIRRNFDLGVFDENRYRAAMIRISADLGRRAEADRLQPRAPESPGLLRAYLGKLQTQRGITLAMLAVRMGVHPSELEFIGLPISQPVVAAPRGLRIDFPRRPVS